jgi:hypothetical protein
MWDDASAVKSSMSFQQIINEHVDWEWFRNPEVASHG